MDNDNQNENQEASLLCKLCKVNTSFLAEDEEDLKLHLAAKHYNAYVCLICEPPVFPLSMNGVKAHYARAHPNEYKANKDAWDKKFKLMAKLLKKNQLQNN